MADAIDKGKFDGRCNRTDCQRPIKGASFWNSSTRAYYCAGCAKAINYWSERDDGIMICTHVTDASQQPASPYEQMRSRRAAV